MSLRRTIELPHAQIAIEERSGYLFVVETGQLRNLRELAEYTTTMDEVIAASGIQKAIIDARGEVGDPPAEVRNAMWDWLMSPERGFAQVAFILPSEMAVARVNMTALSRRAPVRAFESVQEAQRWLTRSTKPNSSVVGMQVQADRSSSRPPPLQRGDAAATAPTERPPSGAPATRAVPRAPGVPSESRPPSDRAQRATPDPSTRGRTASDRGGFRPPEPGPSERARTKGQAPADRAARDSELRPREGAPRQDPTSSQPPKGGGKKGGSQVA